MDTILLTATIQPKGMINVAIINPEERLAQYKEAIEFYINQTNFNIVFCDNSNILLDIKSLNIINKTRKKDIEILTFDGNSIKSKGKGYGEMEIINYALKNSNIIKNIDENKRIIVATGRVIIKNAVNFCNVYQKDEIYFYKHLGKMISVFNIAPLFFWKEFYKSKNKEISDNNAKLYFENKLEEFALTNYEKILNYVKYEPIIVGKTGTKGKLYNETYRTKSSSELNMFICTHKDFEVPQDDFYIPIATKSLFNKEYIDATFGNDRAFKDQAYSELVAYYWLWKNFYSEKYIGICHYRKYFKDKITEKNVSKIMKDCDAIVSLTNFNKTVRQQYQDCHNIKDLEEIHVMIKDIYGEKDAKNFDNIMDGDKFLQCNMIITTSDIFNKYCEVLFTILDEFDKRNNLTDAQSYINHVEQYSDDYIKKNTPNSNVFYQSRIPGYLSERIFTWYFMSKMKSLKTSDIVIGSQD